MVLAYSNFDKAKDLETKILPANEDLCAQFFNTSFKH